MNKALMLGSLFLCTAIGFAAETPRDAAAEGKKRNEAVIELMLEQTGWKSGKTSQSKQSTPEDPQGHTTETSRPKTS